jgi:hypothetical protein
MAVPASAAASDHASSNAAANSAKADGAGNSADHANANAGANANAANNPHAQSSSDGGSSATQSASAPATSTSSSAKTSSSATTTAGNKNAGCHQTAYGATGPGANHSGPYNDTCDGTASGNGNGGGKAVGKPCAGCVGKADEKNPKGQYPGGSDHNKGYECDGNHGIGRTNPAHTGCKTPPPPPPPPPPCVEGVDAECTNPPPPPGCVESATVSCSEVLGETITRTRPTAVLGATTVRTAVLGETGSLPRTGSDVLDPALFAAGLLMLGETLRRVAKRKPATAAGKFTL